MGKAVTTPPDWRRRAAEGALWVLDLPTSEWPAQALYAVFANRLKPPAGAYRPSEGLQERAWLILGIEQASGDAGPLPDDVLEPDSDLGSAALAGWASLETGASEAAERAAVFCRRFAWEQPDDVPGLLIAMGPDGLAPEPVVRAHAGPQDFSAPALGALFLARRFEIGGDFDDLDAAVELHDLTVALGDDVWHPEHVELGWAAAVLYRVTGEQAFLATAERMADVACETQGGDGSWGTASLTATVSAALVEMAEAVESRVGVDEPPAEEPSGEAGG